MGLESSKWLINGEQVQGPNASVPYTISFPWASSVSITTGDNSDVAVYREGDDSETDLADTHITTPHSYSGNQITLGNLHSLQGGEIYIVAVTPTIDGVKDTYWFRVRCPKEHTGRI